MNFDILTKYNFTAQNRENRVNPNTYYNFDDGPYPSKRRHATHNSAAVSIALPNNEKEDRLTYLGEYSCKPPPLLMPILSIAQVLGYP